MDEKIGSLANKHICDIRSECESDEQCITKLQLCVIPPLAESLKACNQDTLKKKIATVCRVRKQLKQRRSIKKLELHLSKKFTVPISEAERRASGSDVAKRLCLENASLKKEAKALKRKLEKSEGQLEELSIKHEVLQEELALHMDKCEANATVSENTVENRKEKEAKLKTQLSDVEAEDTEEDELTDEETKELKQKISSSLFAAKRKLIKKQREPYLALFMNHPSDVVGIKINHLIKFDGGGEWFDGEIVGVEKIEEDRSMTEFQIKYVDNPDEIVTFPLIIDLMMGNLFIRK